MPYAAGMDASSGGSLSFDLPAIYQITIQGTIATSWSERLEGMVISHIALGDGTPYTILTGEVCDQAALTGVLNAIYELHLPLVAVHKLTLGADAGGQKPPEA